MLKEPHIKTNAIRYYEKEGMIKLSRKDNGYREIDEIQMLRLNILKKSMNNILFKYVSLKGET